MIKTNILILLSIFFVFQTALFGQFSEAKIISNEVEDPEPSCVKVADIDGDGDQDVAATFNDADLVMWFENIDGKIEIEHIISSDIEEPRSFDLVDVNGDGEVDFLLGSSSPSGRSSLFANLGDGVFGPEVVLLHESSRAIVGADMDGDGDIDILTENGEQKIIWIENIGGLFLEEENVISEDYFPDLEHLIYTVDLDLDGDIDVISYRKSTKYIVWFENNGFGEFSEETLITESNGFNGLMTQDMDSDGDPDLVYGSGYPAEEIAWKENLGDALFGELHVVDEIVSNSIVSYDVDSDGDNDIISGGYQRISWYENLGLDVFGESQVFGKLPFYYDYLTVGDIDGDEVIDVITASKEDDEILWHKNFSDHFGVERGIFSNNLESCSNMYAIDFNNDSLIDIFGREGYGDGPFWYRQLPSGDFAPRQVLFGGDDAYSFPIDADLDGDLDLFANGLGDDDDINIWFENIGGVEFGEEYIFDESISLKSIEIIDLDNDGLEDILSIEFSHIYWYKKLVGVGFSDAIEITDAVWQGHSVVAADLDLDGDLDVLSASTGDDKVAWYENIGDTLFGPQQIISEEVLLAKSIVSEDINLDGYPDAACISQSGDEVIWFENLGDGTFSDKLIISTAVDWPDVMVSADVDLDGDPDIVYGTRNDNKVAWNENLGDGTFGEQQIIASDYTSASNLSAVDIDNDSDIDILVGGKLALGGGRIDLFENLSFNPNQFRGNCYFDLNENGIKDSTEVGVNHFQVLSTPENDFSYTYGDGRYFMNINGNDYASYSIYPDETDYWSISTDSLSYTVIVDSLFNFADSLDFGFYPDTIVDTVIVDITSGPSRCDTTVNYWLDIKNMGTSIPSGILHLILDDSLDYVGADIVPDSIVAQNIYWHYDSLFYFTHEFINVVISTPNFESMGDTLVSVFNGVVIDSLGDVSFTSTDTVKQILTCAYDPNDKIADPAGLDNLGFITTDISEIEYTIRFQNTGTDTAIKVVIVDYLDANLDWTSLEIISFSDSMNVDIDYMGKTTFTFADIFLPDSAADRLGSQGYVKFKINIKPEASPGTSIYNNAEIYFDSNPAVLTNTKIHTIYDCYSIFENRTLNTELCQNDTLTGYFTALPSNMNIVWSVLDETIENDTILLDTDTTGIFPLNVMLSNDFCMLDTILNVAINAEYYEFMDSISLCTGDSLVIFDTLRYETGTYYNLMNSITGCDSLQAFYLEVKEPIDELFTISICEGDSALVFDEYLFSEGVFSDSLLSIDGCDSLVTINLIVNPVPAVSINEIDPNIMCLNWDDIWLDGSPSGGVFSGTGVLPGFKFDPGFAGLGEHWIYYDYENDFGCQATDSALITVTECLGIDDETINEIMIVPNPMNDYATIHFGKPLTENHVIIIYNLIGEQVFRIDQISGKSLIINREDMVAGSYMLTLYNSNMVEVFTKKIMIE